MFMFFLFYGDKRIRTADICRAKAALYQLSYTPIYNFVTFSTSNYKD